MPPRFSIQQALIASLVATIVLAEAAWLPSTFAKDPVAPPLGFKSLIDSDGFNSWRLTLTPLLSERLPERASSPPEVDMGRWRNTGVELVNNGDGPGLESRQTFGDFELYFDAMVDSESSLELLVRNCPQLELSAAENAVEPPIKLNSATVKIRSKAGTWSNIRCRMVGQYLSISQAGKEIARNVVVANCSDHSTPLPPTGRIGLNGHRNQVRIRNLLVREVPSSEANEVLAALHGDESKFLSIFNSTDFTGWIGAVNNYEIVDGTLRCRAGRGGNLVTAEQFDNFIVRLEFRLPPGGNNGLAVRVPNPDGVPAYDGIEIQVLDDTAEVYASLEPYQYNGSAYGLKAAHRGYLRPVGTWNYEEVVVDGDRVQVRLNGYQILDADLAQLRELPIDGKDHLGAHRTCGHFGFCGHSDPVEFRNIRIKPIETD